MKESKIFELKTDFKPCGDQPQAIDHLIANVKKGKRSQVLLGITGSGKTFTMANVIQKAQKPTLVIAHNKTLAAQLYQEFSQFFPNNAVEYFVSYYDYYQPEAYIPRTDTYIEKDLAINDKIDKMRLSATRSLIERKDVIIVASISCIYGLGLPDYYRDMRLHLRKKMSVRRDDLLLQFVMRHYSRSEDLGRGNFRVRGDVIEILPAYEEDLAYRLEFFGDEIEKISEIDPITGRKILEKEEIFLYPASHHVIPEKIKEEALERIQNELSEREVFFEKNGQLIEKQRIRERTRYDMEMIQEMGFCKGIENYSRHFSLRKEGEPPACLLDYFPKDYLIFIDESHQTLPQMHAMYNGDRSRKKALIDFGFRLPSAYDNRPLTFEEAHAKMSQVIYVSATPAHFEMEEAQGEIIEQIIRPTGLLDPEITVRPATGQVDDILEEISKETSANRRVLVTTLTKKLAEDLSKYLEEMGIKAKYLHSEIDTLERIHIIKDLRLGTFDVLVGINLLREGLDIPEVSLVAILDADKQGFLRSETALIQTCGRAARNVSGRVIMYADERTQAITKTIQETHRRRLLQQEYNHLHHITPTTILKAPAEDIEETFGLPPEEDKDKIEKEVDQKIDLEKKIKESEREMKRAAKEMRFEDAAHFRDLLRYYQSLELIK